MRSTTTFLKIVSKAAFANSRMVVDIDKYLIFSAQSTTGVRSKKLGEKALHGLIRYVFLVFGILLCRRRSTSVNVYLT